MLKRILVSQRVDVVAGYGERRDGVDQKWYEFLYALGLSAVAAPNHAGMRKTLLDEIHFDGILLTGGCSPVAYGGHSPERDAADAALIAHACRTRLPLIGVCRGCQSIALFFGGELKKVENHVAQRHQLKGEMVREVNSYHALAVSENGFPRELTVLSTALDGSIEQLRHQEKALLGIMWHPEREQPFHQLDLCLFRQHFGV